MIQGTRCTPASYQVFIPNSIALGHPSARAEARNPLFFGSGGIFQIDNAYQVPYTGPFSAVGQLIWLWSVRKGAEFMLKVKGRAGESVQQMVRRFKKLCEKEGLIRDMKRMAYYEKPSEKERRRKRKAQRNNNNGP